MTIEDEIPDPEFCVLDLPEAIRWCWRHSANLEFEPKKLTLRVPLRNPKGQSWTLTVPSRSQDAAVWLVPRLVARTRTRLNLE